ncbi:70 kDa peptidyl-prolyl isomerase-like protein [Trifolium pratense]|uniref:70 kDa peptidyl-prolyl isomerase-like protein n=1 Tax=Trifolium pratense TaxID=57577 RepID=A0A2K3NBR9_TRIPR|nr:70 kDa peptidyl-prolyl isomerase-like protein [Trifolium pratense]
MDVGRGAAVKDCGVTYETRLDDGTLVAKYDGVEFSSLSFLICPVLSKPVKTMKKGK